jgi:hypothetical protein
MGRLAGQWPSRHPGPAPDPNGCDCKHWATGLSVGFRFGVVETGARRESFPPLLTKMRLDYTVMAL